MKLLQPKKMIISNGQERFLSPCYEQLRAAFHALDEADKNEFSSGRVPDVTKLDNSPSDLKAWFAGFFFNSAVHRIAWATDRLLELFCYLPDRDQQDLELQQWQTGIRTVLDKTGTRLKEPAFNGCVHVRTVMAALKPADLWSDQVNPSNYLSIIRERVNVQKHAFEGFSYIVRTDATAGTWQHLLDREKMEWGRKAADVLANMYHELYRLYFDVPPVLYPPRSFKLVRS